MQGKMPKKYEGKHNFGIVIGVRCSWLWNGFYHSVHNGNDKKGDNVPTISGRNADENVKNADSSLGYF
jgi:hypothetical protein